jgi:hypothetical protein
LAELSEAQPNAEHQSKTEGLAEGQRRIPLTQGRFAIVDCERFSEISKHRWHFTKNGYAARNSMISGKRVCIYMHRFIANTPDGLETDHINGDTLDNRVSNLRVCRHSENCKNLKLSRANKTGFKGVDRHSQNGNWRAQIMVNGELIHLGCFESPSLAGEAYLNAARKLFGQFNRTTK